MYSNVCTREIRKVLGFMYIILVSGGRGQKTIFARNLSARKDEKPASPLASSLGHRNLMHVRVDQSEGSRRDTPVDCLSKYTINFSQFYSARLHMYSYFSFFSFRILEKSAL